MNNGEVARLRRLVARLGEHEIPRVGWPTTVLPPRGTRVEAYERAHAVTIIVHERRRHGAARLDLSSREVAVSATGRTEEARSRLRRIALEFIADRNAYDQGRGMETRFLPPAFDPHDTATWTEMQLLADVTDSDWYPPEPVDRSSAGWAEFYAAAHRFNDRFMSPGAAARAPHPIQPRGGQ